MKLSDEFKAGVFEGFTTGAAAMIVWIGLMILATLFISLMFSFISLDWEWAWQTRVGRFAMTMIALWAAAYIWKTREDFKD